MAGGDESNRFHRSVRSPQHTHTHAHTVKMWQAGGMHPYWNAFLLDRRAGNERRTACLLYNLYPLSSALPVFTIQQHYIIAHFPRFV